MVAGGDTTQADSSAQIAVGTCMRDVNGGEHIYLRGTASVVAGTWVTFDENFTTTRLAADAVGPVAVAGTAITTNLYGWFQRLGKNTIATTGDTVAADKLLFISGTAGTVDDTDVAGDYIVGANSLASSSSNVCTVWLNYPWVSNDALN